MSFDPKITGFLAQGTAASRPAAPNEATNTLSWWYSSDTTTLSYYDWNAAAWVNISGSTTFCSTTEQLTGTSTTKSSNPDTVAALWEKGADITSGATITIGEGGFFHVTGTTTITAITVTVDTAGRTFFLEFTGALVLTHNATSLILPTGANITTAAGDVAIFTSEGSGNVRCLGYMRASGQALVAAAAGDISPFSDNSITKPAAADFTIADDTTVGHGTGSKANLATRGVELTNTAGANATTQSLFFEAAVSSTLNTMIAYIAPNFGGQNGSNNYFYGIGVRDNAGKIDSFGICFDAGVGNTVWKHATFTNISTAPTISAFNGGHMACGRPIWLKLAKVSTNFVFSASSNGETYDVIATVSATGFVGATLNDVGIILYNALSAGSKTINLDVFSFTKS